jgi:hypothetical protein
VNQRVGKGGRISKDVRSSQVFEKHLSKNMPLHPDFEPE